MHQGAAPGLCASWSATPIDLEPVAPVATTKSLEVHGDGRGGFTLHVRRNDQSRTYLTLTSAGAAYGNTVDVPSNQAVSAHLNAATATATGWVEQWGDDGGDQVAWLVETDTAGNVVKQTAPASPFLWDLQFAALPDGRVDLLSFDVDGASVGRLRDDMAQPYDVLYGVYYRYGSAAVHDHIFFALDGTTLHTVDVDGTTRHIPTTAAAVVLGSSDAHHAVAVAGPLAGTGYQAPSSTAVKGANVTFVGDDALDQTFTLDAEIDVLAAAPRDASHGAVLSWTSDGLTAEGGVALGFAEVAPGGVRGPIVSLGNQVVAAQTLLIEGAGDGSSYLVIESNVSIRKSFIVRCAD